MAFSPITGAPFQYSTDNNELASGYYLKLYDAGTTNAYSMATDSTGSQRLAKCKLNPEGYPITNDMDDDSIFVPHVDQNYRIVLYRNETDADNDATGNAAYNVDSLRPDSAIVQDAEDITLRDVSLEEQDDYDRSPLFVDGTDFTAGVGPHVITVPSATPAWVPSNSDTRFYRLESSGTVTALTPTASDTTTFTLSETLLSTDVIYIGDDNFRNIHDGDPSDIRERLDTLAITNPFSEIAANGSTDQATARANLAPDISGWTKSTVTYTRDSCDPFADFFDVMTLTSSTWESIGPTSSGATNTWSALDDLPDEATYIVIQIKMEGSLASSSVGGAMAFRKNGETVSATQAIRGAASSNVGGATSNFFGLENGHYLVPVDGDNLFEAYRFSSSATSQVKRIGIIAFGVA